MFWDGEQRYYRGTVVCYKAASGLHVIRYDDNQKTKENLQVRARVILISSGNVFQFIVCAKLLEEVAVSTNVPGIVIMISSSSLAFL